MSDAGAEDAAEPVLEPDAGDVADEAGAEPVLDAEPAALEPEPEPADESVGVVLADAALLAVEEAAPVPVRLGVLVRVTPCWGKRKEKRVSARACRSGRVRRSARASTRRGGRRGREGGTYELEADLLGERLGGLGVGGVARVDDALGGRLDVLLVGAQALVVCAAAAEGALGREDAGRGAGCGRAGVSGRTRQGCGKGHVLGKLCRAKMLEALAEETAETMAAAVRAKRMVAKKGTGCG